MKKKRIIILLLLVSISIISLSSCAFFERIAGAVGLGENTGTSTTEVTTTIPTSTTSTVPQTTTDTKVSPTTKSDISTTTSTTKQILPIFTTTTTTTVAPTTTSNITSTTTSELTSTNLDEISDLEYGYNDLERYANKENYQKLYLRFKSRLNDFYLSTTNLTPTQLTVNGETNAYYVIEDVYYTDCENVASNEALAILKTVLLDNPKFYFLSNTVLAGYQTHGSETSYYIKLVADYEYRLGSTRLEYNNQITEFENACMSGITSQMTTKEKVKSIHDYICNHATYAFEADGVTPSNKSISHNLLGIVSEGKGVCESYAELFTYLLKSVDVYAITVTGYGYSSSTSGAERHAWNYVNIDDSYYGFDVTWDDSTSSYDYYGMSYNSLTNGKNSFCGRHVASDSDMTYGINYLYALPNVSSTNLIFLPF